MADTKYKGHEVLVYFNGVPALANVEIKKTRNVIDIPSGNLIGKMKEDGSLDVTGSITFTYFKGDISRRMTRDTVNTGSVIDVTQKSGIAAPGANAEAVGDMTVTDAENGVIKAVVKTASPTCEGYILIEGIDINDKYQVDRIDIPAGAGVNSEHYSTKKFVFKSAPHYIIHNLASTGTVDLVSVVAASSVGIGPVTDFDVEVKAIKTSAGKYVDLNLLNCFFTSETFSFQNSDSYIGQPMELVMRNVNEF